MQEKAYIGTPYDDVFRTLINDCPELVLPVINEMFGENYRGDEQIVFGQNEHFLNQQDGPGEKRITDSSFVVKGERDKKYHLECQSTGDSSMLVRLFEYDTQIALDPKELDGNVLTVTFPHTGVLYLRSNRKLSDKMTIRMITPGGELSYDIAVMKMQSYTLDAIFDRKLYFLIPFYAFVLERQMKAAGEDKEKLSEIINEYAIIENNLNLLLESGDLTSFSQKAIKEMVNVIVASLARHNELIVEGVKSVMGGKILNYEAKDILNRGRQEGRQEGLQEGMQQGRISLLYALVEEGVLSLADAAKRAGVSEQEFSNGMMKIA